MAMTRSDIEKMLGPVDDHLAAEIVRTDASAEDLAQALVWISADEAMVNDGAHMPTGVVAELIGLLDTADEEEPVPAAAAPAANWD